MSTAEDSQRRVRRIGFLYAFGAFGAWGVVLPLYMKALEGVPVLEILAHRVLWAALVTVALIAALGRLGEARRALTRRSIALLMVSAALVTANWVTYIFAVTSDHIIETSLGYFMNPLVSIALGMAVLGERLRPLQLAACLIGALGVVILTTASSGVPWIALTLAFSFGCYGLVRKVVAVESLIGVAFEAAILAPLALGYLLWLAHEGRGSFGIAAPGLDLLLMGSGLATALPLVWFAAAARKLPLTTIGLLQFSSPSATFLLGILAYGEPFSGAEAVTFACVWVALGLYTADALRTRRAVTSRPLTSMR
jgi:chloramphenicol-sensitive protein RarD